jgi:hypothetical protein
MAIRINNSFFKVSNGSFALFKPPMYLGQIYRVVNTGGTTDSLSYTKINGSIASTGNLTSAQVVYILAVSGSLSDSTQVGPNQQLTVTNLLITSSVDTNITFTEQLITTTGAGTWTKPAGVTEVIVECWGGGGAGGGVTSNPAAGAGGGGGQYSRKYIQYTSPSVGVPYSVAASRAGGQGNGTVGNDTTWNTNIVIAKGGTGGTADAVDATGVPGGIGSQAGSIGDVIYFGGDAGEGSVNSNIPTSGTGGGGAGSSVQGAGGFISPPGAGTQLGGNGGLFIEGGSANGNPGSNYGGGGGGAVTNASTNRSGGTGAQGLIRLIYR